jgi:glucose-1-phosphate thymidylyltransferase
MSKIYTVIAAGGLGKRLKDYRGNKSTKMLLKIKNEAMITNQINQLLTWKLSNFIVITNPNFDSLIKSEINTEFPNLDVKFSVQEEQLGVAHALLHAEKFIKQDSKVLYILGDNFFELNPLLGVKFESNNSHMFIKEVSNPQEFGVVELKENKIISIEEKPNYPKSNFIGTGLYLFDYDCFEIIKTLKKSDRGEYEITNLLEKYMNVKRLNYDIVDGWWVDAGTPESVENLEKLI